MTTFLIFALLAQSVAEKTPVIFDHDGGTPDDFIALTMLTRMPSVDLRGVIVSPGVSFSEPAVSVSRKVLDLAGARNVSVAMSTSRGKNPFPTVWRKRIYIADALPVLNQQKSQSAPFSSESGVQFLVRQVKSSKQPVTLLVTGPLSTISDALKADSSIAANISKIVWMGGALQVPGNVSPSDEPSHDGTAEWNAYFDPMAVEMIWKSRIPIVLCPLDATNRVPVTSEFMKRIAALRQHPLADFVGQILALPYSEGSVFFFWDALAAAYLEKPNLFKTMEWEVAVVADGKSQGRLVSRPGSGRKIQVLEAPDGMAFQDSVLGLLTTNQTTRSKSQHTQADQ